MYRFRLRRHGGPPRLCPGAAPVVVENGVPVEHVLEHRLVVPELHVDLLRLQVEHHIDPLAVGGAAEHQLLVFDDYIFILALPQSGEGGPDLGQSGQMPSILAGFGIERAVPISSEMREYVAPSLDEVSQEVVEFIDYVSQPDMASPLMNPDPSAHSEIADLLGQYSEQVRYGQITDLAGTAQQFMDEANQILADAAASAE